MGQSIELQTADGVTIGGYQAEPTNAPKGGVVVIQEIFGVNAHIRSVTDRFAAAGYAAIAPAIFDRAARDVELAYDEAGMKRGMELAKQIPQDQHLLSIDAAIEVLASHGPVAVVGFCLGGSLAYAAATRNAALAAAVGYYGGNIAGMADVAPLCPALLHFGETDQSIPLSDIDKIRQARPEVMMHTYPGAGHGFNCDARSAHHRESADLAWQRTLTFLSEVLDRRQP